MLDEDVRSIKRNMDAWIDGYIDRQSDREMRRQINKRRLMTRQIVR